MKGFRSVRISSFKNNLRKNLRKQNRKLKLSANNLIFKIQLKQSPVIVNVQQNLTENSENQNFINIRNLTSLINLKEKNIIKNLLLPKRLIRNLPNYIGNLPNKILRTLPVTSVAKRVTLKDFVGLTLGSTN